MPATAMAVLGTMSRTPAPEELSSLSTWKRNGAWDKMMPYAMLARKLEKTGLALGGAASTVTGMTG